LAKHVLRERSEQADDGQDGKAAGKGAWRAYSAADPAALEVAWL
jgi:hypothetical protein